MAKKKAKAKRYTPEEKKEILDFIVEQGRGGQTKAVKKYGVTAATIASWKKKSGSTSSSPSPVKAGGSKELKALQELADLLKEIQSTESHLAKLKKAYDSAKAKL